MACAVGLAIAWVSRRSMVGLFGRSGRKGRGLPGSGSARRAATAWARAVSRVVSGEVESALAGVARHAAGEGEQSVAQPSRFLPPWHVIGRARIRAQASRLSVTRAHQIWFQQYPECCGIEGCRLGRLV